MQKIILRILAALAAPLFLLTGLQQSVIGYTEGTPIRATRQDYVFDNDKLLLGGYYALRDELPYCEDAGIEFVVASGVDTAYLDLAEQYGVGVIAAGYQLPSAYGALGDDTTEKWVNADASKLRAHPALWGDDLIDEPAAGSFANIAKCVNAYYQKFPGHLPYVNLFPMYANGEQLGETSKLTALQKLLFLTDHSKEDIELYKMHVSDYINTIDTDYICVDIYPYHAMTNALGKEEKFTSEVWIRNLDILAEACRETGRDLWVITQASGLTKDGSIRDMRWCDEASDISQQSYACLAFGSKAIIQALFSRTGWWDADSHMIGSDGKPTETYDAVAAVNKDLKAFADVYGKYTYSGTYMMNRVLVTGRGVGSLNCENTDERGNVHSANGLLVGTFNGEDGKAYVVANLEELHRNVTASFTFDVPAGQTATVYKKGTAFTMTGSFAMELDPGEGVFITVK